MLFIFPFDLMLKVIESTNIERNIFIANTKELQTNFTNAENGVERIFRFSKNKN